MIKKTEIKGVDKVVSVTFESAHHPDARSLHLVGDFNEWDPAATPMKQRKDGTWAATLRLPRRRDYQYRFVVNGTDWVTDEDGEAAVPNPYGGMNAVVLT